MAIYKIQWHQTWDLSRAPSLSFWKRKVRSLFDSVWAKSFNMTFPIFCVFQSSVFLTLDPTSILKSKFVFYFLSVWFSYPLTSIFRLLNQLLLYVNLKNPVAPKLGFSRVSPRSIFKIIARFLLAIWLIFVSLKWPVLDLFGLINIFLCFFLVVKYSFS